MSLEEERLKRGTWKYRQGHWKNKFAAVYTTGPVTCDWAGAIKPENVENTEKA